MKDEVQSAKVLATSIAYTKKEIQKLKEDFKTSTIKESSVVVGPRGPQGPKGEKGETGPERKIVIEAKGPVGPKGEPGQDGREIYEAKIDDGNLHLNFNDGYTIDVGKVIGPRGGQGIPGEKGEQGLIGETGPKGSKGEMGIQGPIGPRGLLGEQGPPGPQGPVGIEGQKGDKGDKGEQGIAGPQGIQGLQGLIGPRGEKGERGPTGLQGPQGPSGKDGTSVDLKPLKDELQTDLQAFKDNISASVSRKNLAGSGGSGEVRLEFLDDVDRTTAKVDGKFLKFEASSGKFVGASGSNEIENLQANTISIVNPDSYHLYEVKVITKTSSHPYSSGSSLAYSLNGDEAPSIILVPNMTYRFDQSDSTNGSHPLRFYKDAAKSTIYNTGVTTSGTAGSSGAYVQIAVTETTPTLFYQCSSHGYMGSVATVASQSIVQQDITDAVNDLIDAAPTQLNTLNELAAALGDDENFATATTTLINDRMQVANTTLLVNDRLQVANATTLFNDRVQVANVAGLAGLGNTNARIDLINNNLTASNTTLRGLISDRAQVANVVSLAALGNTNLSIASQATRVTLVNTNLVATNTAIRTLVNDRIQVANANATFATKAYAAANTYVNSNFVKADATNISFSGQSVTISGNLIVQGTTTTTTTSSSNVESAFMILNAGLTGTPTNDAGIRVNRGNQSNVEIRFNETSNQFEFTNDGTTFNQLGSVGDSLAFAIALG